MVSLDYQDGAHGDNKEYILQGLWGATGDNGSVLAAISYTNRSPLFLSDRRLSRPQDDTSALGNPGSFFLNIPKYKRENDIIHIIMSRGLSKTVSIPNIKSCNIISLKNY